MTTQREATPASTRDIYGALVSAQAEVTDRGQMQEMIAKRLLGMGTIDDILGAADAGTSSADDIVGRPFKIVQPPVWMEAAPGFTEGTGFFVILTCDMQDDAEEAIPVTCGGSNVLAQLYALQNNANMAFDGSGPAMEFKQVRTAAGFNTLWLKAAGTVQARTAGKGKGKGEPFPDEPAN